jgi:PH domain associated with Beige/BEACH
MRSSVLSRIRIDRYLMLLLQCSLGIVDLFDYVNYSASSVDSVSGGLHGIRLSDDYIKGISASDYYTFIDHNMSNLADQKSGKEIERRICVSLSAQVLTLLDAFIFPESLTASAQSTQLDGLALVRFSEARLGASQGPLMSAGIRLSLLLLALLEPCSITFLQCASRLRCLLCWGLELLREQSTSDVQHIPFHNDGEAHIERLMLAVTLYCHRALGRCRALLWEVETKASDKYLNNKDLQKKICRRLLRASLELRDVVSTAFRGRNEVLRSAMTSEAYEGLRQSLEGDATKVSKESVVRDFLSSHWVNGFTDIVHRQDIAVPEQVSMETIPLSSDAALNPSSQGFHVIEKLALESKNVISEFEIAINSCFEEYLFFQQTWAETDAVRELEYHGDTTSKRLSENYKLDLLEITKTANVRKSMANGRYRAINNKTVDPWKDEKHWILGRYTDMLGRRTLLMQNREFHDHAEASYDFALGKEQEREELERQKRLLMKKDLMDVMRRNAAAFIVEDMQSTNSGEDSSLQQASDGDSTFEMESSTDGESIDNVEVALTHELLVENPKAIDDHDEEWDKIGSEEITDVDVEGRTDAWAKAFIWAEGETLVARFELVTIVSLQSYVEGKLLLTTHGLYFHQLGDEINNITKQAISESEFHDSDTKDRRWRLARLMEVHSRRYMLRHQALELFFADNYELLLNFSNGVKDRDRFHSKLRHSCKVSTVESVSLTN